MHKKWPKTLTAIGLGGDTSLKDYIEVTIITKKGQKLKTPLFLVKDFPHDFLVGYPTLRLLGYDLEYDEKREFTHEGTHGAFEVSENSPFWDKVDYGDLHIKLVELDVPKQGDVRIHKCVKQLLAKYPSIGAKDRYDIGKIPNVEMEIRLKKDAKIHNIKP